MSVETAVLRGDEGVDEMIGDLVDGNGAPVLDENPPELLAVAIHDAAGHLEPFQVLQIKGLSEIVSRLGVQIGANQADHRDHQSQHDGETEELEPADQDAAFLGAAFDFLAEGGEIKTLVIEKGGLHRSAGSFSIKDVVQI